MTSEDAAGRSPGTGPGAAIASLIRERGPIPFDRFMDLALYAAPGAYYERSGGPFGPRGDFYTAPEATPAFGRMLARQIAECLERVGERHLHIVELGAGRGLLAADILDALVAEHSDLIHRVTYGIVERSAAMRTQQAAYLGAHAGRVRWADAPEEIAPGGVQGCIVANEFYDALPVRVVTRRDGTLLERCVGLSAPSGRFVWVDRVVDDAELLDYAERYGAAAAEGTVAEAGLEALRYAVRVASSLRRGFQIVIDYGDRSRRLYDPALRPAGTLLAYREHRAHEDVLAAPGEQDLTAHVNFTALEDGGREGGSTTVGFTTQDRFLIALGLAERIAQLSDASAPCEIRSRLAMLALLHPEGMGGIFKVLVQAKGVEGEGLRGLSDPFAV